MTALDGGVSLCSTGCGQDIMGERTCFVVCINKHLGHEGGYYPINPLYQKFRTSLGVHTDIELYKDCQCCGDVATLWKYNKKTLIVNGERKELKMCSNVVEVMHTKFKVQYE